MGILSYQLAVFFVTIVFLYLYLLASRRYHWFDNPDESRKLHSLAKPTSAGLVFMLPIVSALFIYPQAFPFDANAIGGSLLVLLILGGIDDFKPISARVRLLVTALVCGYFLFTIYNQLNVNFFILAIYFFGLIWWLNLYNFMDGADGMAVFHAIVTLVGYMMLYFLFDDTNSDVRLISTIIYMLIFLFGLLSFLIFNFPIAKMFMGDSGSLSVSFMLAAFALYGLANHVFDEVLIISFHLVFIVDATLTLFARIKFKHRFTEAHSLHCFQAIIHSGKSHVFTSLLYLSLTIITVGSAVVMHIQKVELLIRLFVLIIEASVLSVFWFKFHNKTKFERFIK